METPDGPKSYERVHLRRWEETLSRLEEFGGFFQGNLLSLGSYGDFEKLLSTKFPDTSIEISDWDLRYQSGSDGNRFESAIALEVLEHLQEQDEIPLGTHLFSGLMTMLCETNRLLKQGGFLAISTPNLASYDSVVRAFRGEGTFMYWPQPRELAPFELTYLLNRAGFDVLVLDSFSPYPADNEPGFFFKSLDALLPRLRKSSPRLKGLRDSTLFVIAEKKRSPDEVLLETEGRKVTVPELLKYAPKRIKG